MIIKVNNISEKGIAFNDAIELESSRLLENESDFQEPLNYEIFFRREEHRIRATGRIRTVVSLGCVRCLERFDLKINSKFDIILFPIERVERKSAALEDEEMEYIFYENDQIDIEKILSEQVNLFIPFNPVCHAGCRGICVNCGINMNVEPCQCEMSKSEITFNFDKIKR
jgi:uncharacterized protein